MSVTIRSFNDAGLETFKAYLDRLRTGAIDDPPANILIAESQTEIVSPSVTIDPNASFPNRFEFGQYLAQRLAPIHETRPQTASKIGLWSWLAFCLFDTIAPPAANGARKLRENYHYIASNDYRYRYRHLVRTPWFVCVEHGESGRFILSGTPDTHGEAAEQVLSRTHVASNRPLIAALNRLYLSENESGWATKRGFAGKSKRLGGTLRRVGKVLRQFDLTYDLMAMTPGQIYDLLPREFDRFKS